jgi:hypothetical protein
MARDWWEDPDCPALPDPPAAPKVADLTCHNFWAGSWNRKILYLNAGQIARFDSMAVRATVHAYATLQDVWLQFYRTAPNNPAQVVGKPYDYYITHMPSGSIMDVNGIRQTITLSKSGQSSVDASHLVFRSREGHVFEWPDIDCGGVWQMIVRWPNTIPSSAIQVTAQAAVKYA